MLCLLEEETEVLCGYSWETLEGVHPVLMGSKVTQPPGIPPHPVTPSGSCMFIPKPGQSHLLQFLLGSILCPPQSQGSGVLPPSPARGRLSSRPAGPLQCAVDLSIGHSHSFWLSQSGAGPENLHF